VLQVWATGFYEELDFLNEASNQIRMAELLKGAEGVIVPRVYKEYCTRRLLVTQWIDGIKLSQASKDEIRRLTKVAQESFLKQLLEDGFFHAGEPRSSVLVAWPDISVRISVRDKLFLGAGFS
jgi:predicted unusual protein kinase regulating ubiquinone biosynthesis (AarF/ABC1/UbiB family)